MTESFSLFHLLGCECSLVDSQLEDFAQVLFSEKNIILPFLTPKCSWAASSACFIIHHGYVDCSGLSQHYKMTYPLLLTVNKCHLL